MKKKKKIIKKDFILNEGIFVIHHTLHSLYQNYYHCIPKEIEDTLLELVLKTADMINYPSDDIKYYDILYEEIVKRVKYVEMD